MKMKVFAIIGSPRKTGNTWRVVERIKEQLLTADPNIDFELLFLTDFNIEMCKGCFTCFAIGKEKCPLKDDRDTLEEKMLEADAIIFAAPTYAMGVPAIMKNLIDRFAYASHRPYLFDKAILLVSTVGGVIGSKQTLQQLTMMSSGCKSVIKLSISCPPITMAGFEKRAERKIVKASKALHGLIRTRKQKAPDLVDWAYFSSFKTFIAFDSYRKVCPADYEYYKDKDYFYPLKGHALSQVLGKIVKGLMKVSMGFIVKG